MLVLELEEKLKIRRDLLGNTCEDYAEKRCIDLYIIKSFYYDIKFEDAVFTQQLFDELSNTELGIVNTIYNEIFGTYSDLNFQKMVLEDFYGPYMQCCDKPLDFFGKPTTFLTHYQLKMLISVLNHTTLSLKCYKVVTLFQVVFFY